MSVLIDETATVITNPTPQQKLVMDFCSMINEALGQDRPAIQKLLTRVVRLGNAEYFADHDFFVCVPARKDNDACKDYEANKQHYPLDLRICGFLQGLAGLAGLKLFYHFDDDASRGEKMTHVSVQLLPTT